jgi:hypothetical protein
MFVSIMGASTRTQVSNERQKEASFSRRWQKVPNAFMEALAQGRGGVPINELLKLGKLIQRVNEVYGIILAQLLDVKSR